MSKILQRASQFLRAVQMFAESLTDTEAIEVPYIYDEWKPGVKLTAGTYVTHGVNDVGDPQLYRVEMDHTSAAHWLPENVPSMYTPIGLDGEGHPVWAQPTGAQDAYDKGDIVNHEGVLYISNIDGNTTVPGTDDRWWSVYEGGEGA